MKMLPRAPDAATLKRSEAPVVAARSGAQSLVELSLALPVFLVLIIGILQFALWVRWAGVAQEAARDAAMTAADTYLAQYKRGTWQQAAGMHDDPAAWAAAEAAGIERGQAALRLAPTPGEPNPIVWLMLHENGLAPGEAGNRDIESTVAVWMPTLGLPFLPRLPGLDPYVTHAHVRPSRFYSY